LTVTPVPESATPSRRLLRALVMCDLVDSTGLVETLGDDMAAQLMRQHDRMTRIVLQRHDGLEVDRTDGFLLVFESPTAAVIFALDYQQQLRALAAESGQRLAARVGIHFGEVVTWENSPDDVSRGARVSEIDGLAISIVARLVALALPGQILVSEIAQQIARRVDRQSKEGASYTWLSHGRYALKGIADPIAVFEVGEDGVAPLRPPPVSSKAGPAIPAWRRRGALVASGIALVLLGGIALFFWTHSDLPLSLNERDWVVLGDVVNVNADPTLDAPLAAAFRIGLEESRFVNVVPVVAVRNALVRMQRDHGARIDRDIASEIALREQARGVIVPSIAQYGTSLRVAVELVDPNSSQTVWTQSADAAGTGELLSATDRLLRSARSRLGESLPRIEATSQPLEKATTPSMEALRALSRAMHLEGVGDTAQAEKLLWYAIGIDPDFAAAYARLGAILFSEQRYADAKSTLEKSIAIRDRLSERERVFVAGVLSYFSDPPAMLSAWGLFSNLYPQWSNGPHNIGNVLYERLHDYAKAEKAYRSAASLYNPYRHYTLHSLGHALLAQEKYEEAEKQFRAAIEIAPAAMLFGLADTLAVSGREKEAEHYLDEAPPQDASAEVERSLRRMTLLIRRGQFDAATKALPGLDPLPSAADRWRVMFAAVALRLAANDQAAARDIVSQVIEETSDPAYVGANLTATEHLLYAAYWAARLGLNDRAIDAVALAQGRGAFDRFPVRAGLAELVRAQLALNAGHPLEARRALDGLPRASSLWEAHELRAECAKALGDRPGEVVQLQWLLAHRGLAHAQWIDQFVGQQLRSLALRKAEQRLSQQQRTTAVPIGATATEFALAAKMRP